MTSDSSTPTPILSREDFADRLRGYSLSTAMGDYRSVADDAEALHAHDEALRDAVAVLTEERDAARREREAALLMVEVRDQILSKRGERVAVLEAGLREKEEPGVTMPDSEVILSAEEWLTALMRGYTAARLDKPTGSETDRLLAHDVALRERVAVLEAGLRERDEILHGLSATAANLANEYVDMADRFRAAGFQGHILDLPHIAVRDQVKRARALLGGVPAAAPERQNENSDAWHGGETPPS